MYIHWTDCFNVAGNLRVIYIDSLYHQLIILNVCDRI